MGAGRREEERGSASTVTIAHRRKAAVNPGSAPSAMAIDPTATCPTQHAHQHTHRGHMRSIAAVHTPAGPARPAGPSSPGRRRGPHRPRHRAGGRGPPACHRKDAGCRAPQGKVWVGWGSGHEGGGGTGRSGQFRGTVGDRRGECTVCSRNGGGGRTRPTAVCLPRPGSGRGYSTAGAAAEPAAPRHPHARRRAPPWPAPPEGAQRKTPPLDATVVEHTGHEGSALQRSRPARSPESFRSPRRLRKSRGNV